MNTNKTKVRIAATALAVAAATAGLGAAGIGTAAAGSASSPLPPSAATTVGADADGVQTGDQTAPDAPGATEASEPAGSGEVEGASTETGPSDGNDGGHADPEGVDVQHEGGPAEK